METRSKFTGAVVTPTKERAAASMRTKSNESQKCTENFDPNVCSPESKFHNPPPMLNSVHNAKNPSSRKVNLNQLASPPAKKKIRERKFVIAKKKSRPEESNPSAAAAAAVDCEKCGKAAGKSKCLCLAYESLRASHEEFFNNEHQIQNEVDFDRVSECEIAGIGDERSDCENDELTLKRNREKLMEEARQSVPESGRVMHLVKAFEKLLMIPKSVDYDKNEAEEENKVIKWALPGLQQPPKVSETRISSSSSDFYLTSESLGLDSRLSCSSDGSRGSLSSRTTASGRKSRPSSSESSRTFSRRQWKTKQQKAISQKPFTLTTEQRGRYKEEEFMKKVQRKLPVALGLPKTIDEPEILVKPPVKDRTKPVDSVLHSDTRAVERAEFDNQVAKKMNLIEQYRMEKERQQKLEEEEEIRRLRKELVPKALPMPYFDRPFVPRRSVKHLTIPKEPKFHLPQHKKIKCCMSLDDLPTQLE